MKLNLLYNFSAAYFYNRGKNWKNLTLFYFKINNIFLIGGNMFKSRHSKTVKLKLL